MIIWICVAPRYYSSFKPNAHRRRDSTGELSRTVGSRDPVILGEGWSPLVKSCIRSYSRCQMNVRESIDFFQILFNDFLTAQFPQRGGYYCGNEPSLRSFEVRPRAGLIIPAGRYCGQMSLLVRSFVTHVVIR